MSLPERSAALLMQVILLIEASLIKKGLTKEEAETIAKETCNTLRKDFGGEQFYFPKGHNLDVLLRQHEIYKRFTGNNQNELSKEFNMSETHIYRILKEGYKKELNERQPQLFE